jgi:hypothetical protein
MNLVVVVVVSAADVDWVDRYREALVCGHRVSEADIARLEHRSERRSDGRLTVAARERIAAVLTGELRERNGGAPQRPASCWRHCEG